VSTSQPSEDPQPSFIPQVMPGRIDQEPGFLFAQQRWLDAQSAADTIRATLRTLDQAVNARYTEWQDVITRLVSAEKENSGRPEQEKRP
jgi:hypothetical protein